MFDPWHVVSIYRRGGDGDPPWLTTPVATAVTCRGQPQKGGAVDQTEAGRIANTVFWFRLPTGTDLRQDDGVKITSSWLTAMANRRLLVREANDWGETGGLQAVLVDTHEEF